MPKIDVNKLLNLVSQGKEPLIKYYIIGMWLITDDYNADGFIIDFMVCKGSTFLEAIDEAKKYENTIKKMQPDEQLYFPLTVGRTLLEATINSDKIANLLYKQCLLPDSKEICELFEKVKEKDKIWCD